ncbi:MAG TPA: hypothetical protein PLQ19_04755 [Aeromicrobium sp.]|nr:hypothetical protein [Aeromicrobium sp.]
MTRLTQRSSALALAAIFCGALLVGCDSSNKKPEQTNTILSVPSGTAVAAMNADQVAASQFLFESATAVILAKPGDTAALAAAKKYAVPILPADSAGRTEAKRLGARVLDLTDPDIDRSPNPRRAKPATVAIAAAPTAELTHLAKLGDANLVPTSPDPRTDPKSIKALESTGDSALLAIGLAAYPIEAIRTHAKVPAGGYLALPGHHYLAMYGHPSTSALGVLGEQSPKKSVARVQKLVKKYEAVAPDESFVPAFEIITTIASAGPGKRKDYSHRTPVSELRPLVDAAKGAGVTVILDLQPGRSKAITQAKAYRELLLEPHVGLALDPEWKLGKHGRPLQRIGHMSTSEINEVSRWLAKLTRENVLPQKLFVVHQFQTQMVRDRNRLVTSRPELATIIHVDGQGPPAAKMSTWKMIRKDAPSGVFWGWKNFVDEDKPMLTAEQTWRRVRPHPDLITYQ